MRTRNGVLYLYFALSSSKDGVAAEQAVAADRFAREIGAILVRSDTARLRQLNGRALGTAREV
jgi:hypothetical protein